MAGTFDLLYTQNFTATDTIVVNHGLNRYQVGVIVNVDGVVRNDLLQSITLDPVDPRNSLTIVMDSSQTGAVKVVDSDYSWANMPTPEGAVSIESLPSLVNHGSAASAPASPPPSAGDTYYDTTINSQMVYDGTRSKWLSVESCTFQYGSNKDREDQYLYLPGNLQGNSDRGYAVPLDSTIVAIGYTRDNASDTPTFQVRSNGSSVATIASAANVTEGIDSTIDVDITAAEHIVGYVAGDKAKHPSFWVRLKWRR